MNTPAAISLVALIALIGYITHPYIVRWWHTARPTRCPICRRWKRTDSMTFARHNSGSRVRMCKTCYRHLYSPYTQDADHHDANA